MLRRPSGRGACQQRRETGKQARIGFPVSVDRSSCDGNAAAPSERAWLLRFWHRGRERRRTARTSGLPIHTPAGFETGRTGRAAGVSVGMRPCASAEPRASPAACLARAASTGAGRWNGLAWVLRCAEGVAGTHKVGSKEAVSKRRWMGEAPLGRCSRGRSLVPLRPRQSQSEPPNICPRIAVFLTFHHLQLYRSARAPPDVLRY